jgi:hypothetical protein
MINILKSPLGRIIVSILWGLGLACIFRKACKGRDCIVYKAPSPDVIKEKTYMFNDKCYQYSVMPTKCTKDAIDI